MISEPTHALPNKMASSSLWLKSICTLHFLYSFIHGWVTRLTDSVVIVNSRLLTWVCKDLYQMVYFDSSGGGRSYNSSNFSFFEASLDWFPSQLHSFTFPLTGLYMHPPTLSPPTLLPDFVNVYFLGHRHPGWGQTESQSIMIYIALWLKVLNASTCSYLLLVFLWKSAQFTCPFASWITKFVFWSSILWFSFYRYYVFILLHMNNW